MLCETVKSFITKVGREARDDLEEDCISEKCSVLNQKLDALLNTLDMEAQAAQSLSGAHSSSSSSGGGGDAGGGAAGAAGARAGVSAAATTSKVYICAVFRVFDADRNKLCVIAQISVVRARVNFCMHALMVVDFLLFACEHQPCMCRVFTCVAGQSL